MIPKIEFRYSGVYDNRYRKSKLILKSLKKINEDYPSVDYIKGYINKIKKFWGKQERKILREISKIYGLKWKEKKIKAYVIGAGRDFSDPLTINVRKDKDQFVDTLTHELMHVLQDHNSKIMKKWLPYLIKNYRDYSIETRNHILIHSVHTIILKENFGEERLKKNINRSVAGYKSSWEIVEREGAENIIKKFKQVIK